MDKGGPGEKERKEVHLGEKLFTFPRTQTQIHKRNMQIQIHKYNCTNTNTKIHIPGEKEVGRKEVYLGEKLFTFPSDRLGRLQDHTENHRSGQF